MTPRTDAPLKMYEMPRAVAAEGLSLHNSGEMAAQKANALLFLLPDKLRTQALTLLDLNDAAGFTAGSYVDNSLKATPQHPGNKSNVVSLMSYNA